MITLILAHDEAGLIGRDGALPWHLPADLKRFKALTIGKPMIMGRKTFESFPAPLPGRRHIVLTNAPDWSAQGAEVAHDIQAALAMAGGGDVSVIGGAQIFRAFEMLADRAEVTIIHRHYPGDTHFMLDSAAWRETGRIDHPESDDRPAYSFVTFARR